MNSNLRNKKTLVDGKLNVKVLLAGLWISVMFLYIYVDYFSLYREGSIEDISAGKVAGFDITQVWLVSAMTLMTIPTLMIFLSLYMKARTNRYANIVVGSAYALVTVGYTVGETYAYYVLGSGLELAFIGGILYLAWNWPAAEVASAPDA